MTFSNFLCFKHCKCNDLGFKDTIMHRKVTQHEQYCTFNSLFSTSSPSANKVEICQVWFAVWTAPVPVGLSNPQFCVINSASVWHRADFHVSVGLPTESSLLPLSSDFWLTRPSCTSGGWPWTTLFACMPESLCGCACMCVCLCACGIGD